MAQFKMPTLNRRSLFMTAAAAGALTSKIALAGAEASAFVRGKDGMWPRLPDVDTESRGDFLLGMSIMNNGGWLQQAARERAAVILKGAGIDPEAATPFDKAVTLLSGDPVLESYAASRSTHQRLKYRLLQREFHSKADEYLAAFEAAEKQGKRPLELNPTMFLPEYTKSEIHTQPGGYVGDPFAGYMYRYGTDWGVNNGRSFQDGGHIAQAAGVATPTNGKVKRVLDLGTSIGQLATSMKSRFPEAEVWGIDVGAPMVRYAHMKAVNQGSDVAFAQRLAEDTKFPDDHFDVVTASILFHEVTAEAAKKILRETARVLRPGGVFYPLDFYTQRPPPKTGWEQFSAFWTHRWNNEDWMLEYAALDFEGEMKKSGMKVGRGTNGNLFGTKA